MTMAPDGRRLPRIDLGRLARFSPGRWPVRWRLALVSASLTFVILVVFALIVGRLATDRLKSDFETEVRETAGRLATQTQVQTDPVTAARRLVPRLVGIGENDVVHFVYHDGEPVRGSLAGPPLGPPDPADTRRVGNLLVATSVVPTTANSPQPVYVQYARDRSELVATIDRLWLFLGGGLVGGTLLATLAGLAVAGRAMRPISALTAAAREIAATRDPSRRVPRPHSDDEVAELATTLDEMLRQLDAARGESEQMVEAQREFVADASHELRTPLTSILANLELLEARREASDPGGEDAEIVTSALSSSRRMRRLVSDLLLLARADAGRLGTRKPCDLARITAGALGEAESLASGHRLVLESDDALPVSGDPDELHRLVLNLLENGIRHTPPGTEIRAALRAENGSAVVEVSDDGPGLPGGLGDDVFSRFVRGGGPADRATRAGTGLGLAIVKAVAESHGGSVEAGAGPRGGARFTVRLPISAAPPAALKAV